MFFERLKYLMKENNVTFAQLERTLGFSNGSMARWEKSSPSVEKVQKVADYFNVSVDYLLGRTDNPKSIVSPQILRITTKDGKALTEEEMQKVIDFAEMVVKARDK